MPRAGAHVAPESAQATFMTESIDLRRAEAVARYAAEAADK
jgi:hypothetical protein